MTYEEFKNSKKDLKYFPKEELNDFLIMASQKGHQDIVKLLLPFSDPKARDSEALRFACWHGCLDVVKLLIPVSDPKARDSEALFYACSDSNLEVIDMLYKVSDIKGVLNSFEEYKLEFQGVKYLEKLLDINTQKENFAKELKSNLPNKLRNKL